MDSADPRELPADHRDRPAADTAAPAEAVSPADADVAVTELLRALADVHDTIPRCASCRNFLAVVARGRRELDGLEVPAAGAARERLDAWLAEAEGRLKTTNRCEVCVPAGPFERFLQALGRSA
jgi:hypothetical protein